MSDPLNPDVADFNRGELLYAIRHDCVSLFAFYLGDELTMEVPELHIDVWNQLLAKLEQLDLEGVEAKLRKLIGIPRGHAKSTIAKLACILFLRYSPLSFCLYASKTNGIAKNAIRDILMWLDSPQERQLYGPMITVKSSETESLWIVDIATRQTADGPIKYKRVIFKAMGAENQVRGLLILNKRPDLIVVDDIEDNDNTTIEQQPKLDTWFLGAFRKSWAKRHFVFFIGNMIRKTTLLARLARDPHWNPTVYGALVRDEHGNLRALWEGLWTVEALLEEYAEYRSLGNGHIWEAEMMNLTQDEILAGNLDNVVRVAHPNPEDLEGGFIAVDPAFGDKSWNDDTAITVHARIKKIGIPTIIDSRVGKMTEDQIFDNLIELSYAWGISTWLIESEAAQKLLLSYFKLLMQIRKINEDVFLMIPVGTGKKSKSTRIIAYRNSVSSGSYGIDDTQQDVVEKLLVYTAESADHDDLLDSASYGLIGWTYFGEIIESRGIIQIALVINSDGMIGTPVRSEAYVSSF